MAGFDRNRWLVSIGIDGCNRRNPHLDLVGGGGAGGVAGQATLSGFQEFLGPGVEEALRDCLAAAERGDALLAAQALEDDADLFLGGVVLAGRSADVTHNLL